MTLVIDNLLKDSLNITEADLKSHYETQISAKIKKNSLRAFFTDLANTLETESKKARTLRQQKAQEVKELKAEVRAKRKVPTSQSNISDSIDDDEQMSTEPHIFETPQTATPLSSLRSISASETGHKRTISDVSAHSYHSQSTDTEAQNVLQLEASVQQYQNSFVNDVMSALGWDSGIPVAWTQNRNMWLSYAPYVLSKIFYSI